MSRSTLICTSAALLFGSSLVGSPAYAQDETTQAATENIEVKSLEEMEAQLEEMGTKLDNLSSELEDTTRHSQALVKEALVLVRNQQAETAAASSSTTSVKATEKESITVNLSTPVAAAPKVVIISPEGETITITELNEQVNSEAFEALTGGQNRKSPQVEAIFKRAEADLNQVIITHHVDGQPIQYEEIERAVEAHQRTLSQRLRETEREIRRAEARMDSERRRVERKEEKARRVAERARRMATEKAVFSGNPVVEADEVVKEFVLFSGNGEIEGTVEGDAVLLAGNLLVKDGAVIEGDAVVLAGNLSVEDGASIDGDAVVTAGKLNVEDGAHIGGDEVQMALSPWDVPNIEHGHHTYTITYDDVEDAVAEWDDEESETFGDSVQSALARFLLLCASGLMLMTFLPGRTRMVGKTLSRRFGASMLTGTLVSLSIVPVSALLAISIIGIPFLAVMGLGIAFASLMGTVAIALQVGRHLPIQSRVPAWLLVGGAGTIAIIAELPVLGPVVLTTMGFAGLGAVLLSRFGESPHQTQA